MKILNAIHAQSIGGVAQVFRNYSEMLVADGHEVALVISRTKDGKSYSSTGVKKIFQLQNFSQIFDCLHLLLILWRFRPDVILCHSNRLMKWMRILRFFSRTKSVAINHGISFKSSLHCDYVISINQQISDLVVRAGHDGSKSFVLPNAIKIDEIYRKKFPKNPLTIGVYGRIEPRKGFDILFKAAAILAEKNLDFRLKIGGFEVSGNYNWQHLQGLAKDLKIFDKCQFVGVVYDKKNFFSDVDIFCVPSREEPFGLVILEGFLHSTLVISSDSDGGKFLIENGKNGLLFESENSAELAEKIGKIFQDSSSYNTITESAFLRLEKEFSFSAIRKFLQQILSKISSKSEG